MTGSEDDRYSIQILFDNLERASIVGSLFSGELSPLGIDITIGTTEEGWYFVKLWLPPGTTEEQFSEWEISLQAMTTRLQAVFDQNNNMN